MKTGGRFLVGICILVLTFSFTVRCLDSKGSTFTSGYNTIGKKVKYNGK